MDFPELASALQSFRLIKGSLEKLEEEIRLLQSPQDLYREYLASMRAVLDGAISEFCQTDDTTAQANSRENIIQHSSSIRYVEENPQEGYMKAREACRKRVSDGLRELCENVLRAMDTEPVKAALESGSLSRDIPLGFGESSVSAGSRTVTEHEVFDEDVTRTMFTESSAAAKRPMPDDRETSSPEPGRYPTTTMVKKRKHHQQDELDATIAPVCARNIPRRGSPPANTTCETAPSSLDELHTRAKRDGEDRRRSIVTELSEQQDLKALEAMALEVKQDAEVNGEPIPSLIRKIYCFLNSTKDDSCIRWSEKGDSFIIFNEYEATKKLIADVFKHSSFTTFVQQLKAYGFRERVGTSEEPKTMGEPNNQRQSEYSSPFFRRGHPNLLWLISKSESPWKELPSQNCGDLNVDLVQTQDDKNGDEIQHASMTSPNAGSVPLTDTKMTCHGENAFDNKSGPIRVVDADGSLIGTIEIPSSLSRLIRIVDADGDLIGAIEIPSSLRDPLVAKVLKSLVLKDIRIRRGRRFTRKQLAIITSARTSSSKLLACFIQAGGEVMHTPCKSCQGLQRPFEDCMMLDGIASRCGSCEWNHHGCYDASHMEWEVYQVKTRKFTSAAPEHATRKQFLRWVKEYQHFKYLSEWGTFSISLKELAHIRLGAKAWRAHFAINKPNSFRAIADQPCEVDVMITFRNETIAGLFQEFCDETSKEEDLIMVKEENPSNMVHSWANMASETILSNQVIEDGDWRM